MRKQYDLTKRHARVRALPIIAGKQNPHRSTVTVAREEVAPVGAATCAIEMPLSPPRKRRAKKTKTGAFDTDSDL